MDPKDFRQRRTDGQGGWIWNMKGVERVLYQLPEVITAETVLLLEGDKDVDRVRSLGFTATTNVGGADKWSDSYSASLEGKDVVIIPDNDQPGRDHVQKVGAGLQGVAKSVRVLELPGLPEHGDILDWLDAGGRAEELLRLIEEAVEFEVEEGPSEDAKKQYPRKAFPWEVLPERVARSLQQLARSCATSATSLPGVAFAILASVIGSIVHVSPKASWLEPLIFWFADIRSSGDGKTPPARLLCRVLYESQSKAEAEYREKLEVWESLSKKDRGHPPARPRGYFITSLTLEGLREDHSGHGGKVIILDELSAFISGQNEYKSKGTDRENWLCLHDGQPARIVRAGKVVTISGARISFFGGIQPGVWRRSFTEEEGLYLADGTIYRVLPTYEGSGFHPLTAEAWSEDNRVVWESLLQAAIDWADRMLNKEEKLTLILSQEAQEHFLNWRNDLFLSRTELPGAVRGFIPKLVGYALRLAGIIHLMERFEGPADIEEKESFDFSLPSVSILDVEAVQKGVEVSEFYLGHILLAMEVIQGDVPDVAEYTDQTIHLAKVLRSLEQGVDNGMLAIGFVREKFNESCEKALTIRSPHLMGSVLRRCGLTTTGGKHTANGRVGVFCLVWDEKLRSFLESCPNSPTSPQKQGCQGSPGMDTSCPKMEVERIEADG